MRKIAAVMTACTVLGIGGVMAQQPAGQPKASVVPPIKSVTSGQFDIAAGEVVELTHEKILFKFNGVRRGRSRDGRSNDASDKAELQIHGRGLVIGTGQRASLANDGRGGRTYAVRGEGRSSRNSSGGGCYVDLLRIISPSGLPPIATFRLSC